MMAARSAAPPILAWPPLSFKFTTGDYVQHDALTPAARNQAGGARRATRALSRAACQRELARSISRNQFRAPVSSTGLVRPRLSWTRAPRVKRLHQGADVSRTRFPRAPFSDLGA